MKFFFFLIFFFIETYSFQLNYLKETYKNFLKEPVNYKYYTEDIKFHSNLFPTIQGKEKYEFLLNTLQFISKHFFLSYKIEIASSKETPQKIELLWKLKGQTKILYPISIDGFSTYKKNSLGYFNEHNITFFISPVYLPSRNTSLFFHPPFCTFQDDCLYKNDCILMKLTKNCCKMNHYPHPWLNKPIKVFHTYLKE